jgi:uncharacterized protein
MSRCHHRAFAGSHELYIRSLVHRLVQPPNNCRVVVLNARGCGQLEILTPRLFNGAYTEDLRDVVRHVQQRVPSAPLIGVGFSLGANTLVKVRHARLHIAIHRD